MKDNAIPRETRAELLVNEKDFKAINSKICEINKALKNEYKNTDKDIEVKISYIGDFTEKVFTNDVKKKLITALFTLPYGIQKMSSDIEGLVQTSLNMGILKTKESEIVMSYSVRSSIGTEKKELVDKLICLMECIGGTVTLNGEYPAWEYKKDSKLRNLMADIYKDKYGKDAIIQAMHAGVECGIFAGNLEGLDCVSIGPDMCDIHTPNEKLSISSVKRTWEYLLEVLENVCK